MRNLRNTLFFIGFLAACGGGAPPRTTLTDDVEFDEERESPAARHPANETVERGESALARGQVREAKALFEAAVAADASDARARLDL
ncbi:MAG: hypothetical protein H5U40_09850, partial [Polyangiaceae bacterium]|nr:hypothetical protein [Polyangiaceae bacterium]